MDAETRSSNVDGYHYSGMICIAPKIWVHTVTRADCWAEKKILDNEQLTDEIDESYPQRIGWGGGGDSDGYFFFFSYPQRNLISVSNSDGLWDGQIYWRLGRDPEMNETRTRIR